MFILSKAIYFLINPTTWITVAFVLALFKKRHRLKFLRIGLILFFFFSFIPIFQVFAYLWEVPLTDMDKIEQKYDVGIVLGGFSKGNVKPFDRLHFTSASTRLTTAIELYQRGIIKKILITGGSFVKPEGQLAEAERVQVFLRKMNIPEEDILIEGESLNTRENALFSKKIINKNIPNANQLLLITSAWHMRRSNACFKKAGLKCDIFSTDPFKGRLDTALYYYFFPSASALKGWQLLTKEWFGFVMYKIVGYI